MGNDGNVTPKSKVHIVIAKGRNRTLETNNVELLNNINPPVWQWLLDNLLAVENEMWLYRRMPRRPWSVYVRN